MDSELAEQILEFGKHIAGSGPITAAFIFGDFILAANTKRTPAEAIFVIRGFRPKLMSYVKAFGDRTAVMVACDEWVFERDVDRGFLGEALAWGLIFPYIPLIHAEYLHAQEIRLKRRLILELLENLILEYPELSHELQIEPEYFMYEAMLSRVRLFPPMIDSLLNFMQEKNRNQNSELVLQGYREALEKLKGEKLVSLSGSCVRISEDLIKSAQNPAVRLLNISKTVPRRLFTSLLHTLPRFLGILSENSEIMSRLQRFGRANVKAVTEVEVPENYVYVPTSSGLVTLADRTDIAGFVRKSLSAGKEADVTVQPLGGMLNDVYLVKISVGGDEKKIVVKQFKDWSGFKWFPLSLWSIGTKSFAVLGRARLERECSISQLLSSRGFAVPKLLHVSPEERLVFMEYVEGENVTQVIKRLARSKTWAGKQRELKVIGRIGRKFAKVHALSIGLGDAKPENIMIGEHSEIYFMDFEQASRNGDRVWDVAEFLYYAGHDLPPVAEAKTAEMIAEAFIIGYLAAGGKTETVKKAGTPKYTKVFSIFTAPHVVLAISNVCRRADEMKE